MRLKEGDPVPDFEAYDHEGKRYTPAEWEGKQILLSFLRYASCPMCHARIQELIQQAQKWNPVVVFQSPALSIEEALEGRKVPIPLLADPEMELYNLFGVESSLWGLIRSFFTLNPYKAMAQGLKPKRIEGDIKRLPAEFLIGPDGHILKAHYGRYIGDYLPLKNI